MSEYGGKFAPKKKDPLKPFIPVIGLFLAIIAGAIAYFASEPALEVVKTYIAIGDAPEMRWVVAGAIFLLIIMVVGMLYTVFQPRLPKGVSESDLDREKQEKAKEAAAAARRKREMQAKMRQQRK